MAEVIDGKSVAEDVVRTVKTLTAELVAKGKAKPGLAVVIVGEDPASQVYVASKSRTAKECGFHSLQHTLPAETSEEALLKIIGDLNADPGVNGILVQLPLPAHIDAGKIIQTIAPEKDVDGFHFINVGKLGTGELDTAFVPCTPAGSMLLIERVRGRTCPASTPSSSAAPTSSASRWPTCCLPPTAPSPSPTAARRTCRRLPARPTSLSPPSAGRR